MSKELEALNDLGDRLASVDTSKSIEEAHYDVFPIIRQALTPPTAEEVCKELSEYFNDKVIEMETTFYLPNKDFNSRIIVLMHYDDNLNFKIDLPPRLITLIGRFYEAQQ